MLDYIKSPKELSNWMSKNVKYGYMNKNKKICTDDSFDNYILQYPCTLLNSEVGACWDQTFFEKFIFENNIHLPYKIFYIEQKNKLWSTHTFLTYTDKNKSYYFENSYEKFRGIKEFKNESEIISYVLNNMRIDNPDNGCEIREITKEPDYGCSCIEFMDFCIKGKLCKEGIFIKRLLKADKNMKVFLGGTCAESKWRDELIPLLKIDFFNPVVDDWNEEAQKEEIYEREHDDFCLYTITPKMEGVYSICEVTDDSNKRPEKTIFCLLKEDSGKTFTEGQLKSLIQVGEMIKRNGGKFFTELEDVAEYLNK